MHKRTPGRPRKIPAIQSKVKRSVGRPKKKISETKTIEKLNDVCQKQCVLDIRSYEISEGATEKSIIVNRQMIDGVTSNPIQQLSTNASQTQNIIKPDDTNTANEFYDDRLEVKDDPDFDREAECSEDVDQCSDEDFVSSNRKIGKHKTIGIKRKVGRPRQHTEMKFECIECEAIFETSKLLNVSST